MKHMPEVLQYHVLIACVVPSLLLTGQTITTIVEQLYGGKQGKVANTLYIKTHGPCATH